MKRTTYFFSEFSLDPAAREIYRGAARVDLPGSALDCLVYLVEHRDRAVGRDELIAAVWGRTDVSDTQLSQTVSRVRQALDDTAGLQGTIRTIPRFGYRWVAATRSEAGVIAASAAGAVGPVSAVGSEPGGREPVDIAAVAEPASAAPARRTGFSRRARRIGLAALAAGVAIAWAMARLPSPPADSPAPPAAGDASATVPAIAVLPARVDAPSEWRWLRLGLMSLVADRLRDGDLPTMPSEAVIGLISPQGALPEGDTDSAALAGAAGLRIWPEATVEGARWRVRLRAVSASETQIVEAVSDNVLSAARSAADQLLIRSGHKPPAAADGGLAQEELIRRVRAASLAGQLALADTLIREAPPELRSQPDVQLSAAVNVSRSGDYRQAEQMALALLDTPAARTRPTLRGQTLNLLGAIASREDDLAKASQLYDEAIEQLRDQSTRRDLGLAYLGQGLIAAEQLRYEEAIALLGRARVEMAAGGDPLGEAEIDANLGAIQALRHRPHVALGILEAAEQRFFQLGAQEQRALMLTNLVQVLIQLAEHERALAVSDRFWPPETHTANQRLLWRLVWTRAAALVDNGKLSEARTLLDRIETGADPERDAEVRTIAAQLKAQLADVAGDMPEALRLSAAASTPSLRERDPVGYLKMGLLHAHALRALGDPRQAQAQIDALALDAGANADPRLALYLALGQADQALAGRGLAAAQTHYDEALKGALALAIPEDVIGVSRAYAEALLAQDHLQQAQAVAGGIAMWAGRDFYAAWTQACVLRRLDPGRAAVEAATTAVRLAGERMLPTPLCGKGLGSPQP
ncbi:MAG TPA: winged helix-turn-helix domain-containing protein [Dokdonella sp.]|uniref:winged helix-turn-helix domain-containing protein n=1 Tax=Dokdonella sp. TaxID=2291710 RepID=UPI002C2E7DCF|nr:winged helix-turn-helix domain-containing protein [Dokdonella sp.]HUD43484.1 winged helix-turn-helix domain-containing protein [Dokdonella sp.]